jgi:hypothetical protein
MPPWRQMMRGLLPSFRAADPLGPSTGNNQFAGFSQGFPSSPRLTVQSLPGLHMTPDVCAPVDKRSLPGSARKMTETAHLSRPFGILCW